MTVYMLIGYPGCGKTTYAKKLAEKKNADLFIVDDIIRENHKKELTHRQCLKEVDALFFRKLSAVIMHNRNIIVEGNYLTKERRRELFLTVDFVRKNCKDYLTKNPAYQRVILRNKLMTNLNTKVVAIHINNDLKDCIEKVHKRDGYEGIDTLESKRKKEVPEMNEGFYAITTIHNDYGEVVM